MCHDSETDSRVNRDACRQVGARSLVVVPLQRTVASHWTSLARDTDVVGRIGGDEFAVILEQADEGTAREVAHRLVRGLPVGRRCSVGVASWDGAEDALALLTRADAGMYLSKRAAKGSTLESMARNRRHRRVARSGDR